jgi:hypothetical protein
MKIFPQIHQLILFIKIRLTWRWFGQKKLNSFSMWSATTLNLQMM